MRRLLRIVMLGAVLVVASDHLVAQPLPGSQLPRDANKCELCHGEAELWQGEQQRLHVSAKDLAEDVHWNKGVNCHDCHGGDPTSEQFGSLHRKEVGFRATAEEVREACGKCHESQFIDIARRGVHAKAGKKNERGEGTPIECSDCHGVVHHRLLPFTDPRSPVSQDHQTETCGACHERYLETHAASVHSPDIYEEGPFPMASCVDCHGSHGVYRAADKRSTLYVTQVGTTCGKCHEGIEAKLHASVHGPGKDPNESTDRRLPRWEKDRRPWCTSCHQRHEPASQEAPELASQHKGRNRCSNCHGQLWVEHGVRWHAELTSSGYVSAATCSECHGAHEIPPIHDPTSPMAAENRRQTCAECHPDATKNYAAYNPHADHKDAENHPFLHKVYAWLKAVITVVLVFFGIHSFLWLLRSVIHVLMYGRQKTLASDRRAIKRFSPTHRILHFVVLISLMGLAITGLAMHFSSQAWVRTLADTLGGLLVVRTAHYGFALSTMGLCLFYLCRLLYLLVMMKQAAQRTGRRLCWKTLLFGPDSLVPSKRDIQDMIGMGRWFIGLSPKPLFERWAYWEKFDYWGMVLIVLVIGTSGLILWVPNLFTLVLPGTTLNLAKMIHSAISLPATSLLLAIHYFNMHFRPEKFPMDFSVLTGLVSEKHLERARPEFLQRLQQEGRLSQLRTTLPSGGRMWGIILGGALAHVFGIALVLGILWAGLGQ